MTTPANISFRLVHMKLCVLFLNHRRSSFGFKTSLKGLSQQIKDGRKLLNTFLVHPSSKEVRVLDLSSILSVQQPYEIGQAKRQKDIARCCLLAYVILNTIIPVIKYIYKCIYIHINTQFNKRGASSVLFSGHYYYSHQEQYLNITKILLRILLKIILSWTCQKFMGLDTE